MPVRLRDAGPDDAERVAALHADSWRRHYRGAYSDAFLDGDVLSDRVAVWSGRLADPRHSLTALAEDGTELVGFVHVILDKDERWGSLVDNLHLTHDRQRGGIGRRLLARAGEGVADRAASRATYLWVLRQNVAAQGFYRALGGIPVETATVPPPGGVPGRLNGSPACYRFAWPDGIGAVVGARRAPDR